MTLESCFDACLRAVIEYQEELIPGYRERAEQAERERDAAASLIQKLRVYKCDYCKYKKDLCGLKACDGCVREQNGMDHWEWEGPEEN